MKLIKYQLCTEINHGTEDEPQIEQVFSAVTLGWSEVNEEIAKAEAYNGEYTIGEESDNRPFEEIQTEKLSSLRNLQSNYRRWHGRRNNRRHRTF